MVAPQGTHQLGPWQAAPRRGAQRPTSSRKEVPIPNLHILCQRKRRNRVCRAVHPLHRPTTLVADTECREALRYLRDRLRLSGGGGPRKGPPAGRVVPPRDDLDWRDRAIRAEALLERVQVELQESKDRNTALELRIQDLETQNRNLYGQACVAEQWNEWFQAQQEKGFLAGYHQETPQHTPRSTPRGTPGRGSRGRSTRGRSGSEDDGLLSNK